MKKFIASLFALALTLCAFTSQAQFSSPTYSPVTLTNFTTCAASAANAVALTIDCRKQASVNVQIVQTNDASGTAAVTYVFRRSVDGSKWDTLQNSVVGVAANGTTEVVCTTNLPTQGAGYIQLQYITNAAASANAGSINIKYGVKMSAP